MNAQKYLIVNADDFGQSAGINSGIIEAHERGIVTSASLMARWPAALEAAAYAREHPQLSLGLHVDLGEWAYRGNTWIPLYTVVPADDDKVVRDEISRQLAAFRRLVGKNPSHIDSHQHVHLREPIRSLLAETASKLGVSVRSCTGIRYCGEFYGQTAEGAPLPDRITVDGLIRIVAGLPSGVTELGCHPGQQDDLDTMYRHERARELAVLCDPRARVSIAAAGMELCSFHSEFARMTVGLELEKRKSSDEHGEV